MRPDARQRLVYVGAACMGVSYQIPACTERDRGRRSYGYRCESHVIEIDIVCGTYRKAQHLHARLQSDAFHRYILPCLPSSGIGYGYVCSEYGSSR